MPLMTVSSPTRRVFMQSALGTFAALRLRGADASSLKWALLSDTHIAANPADEYRSFKPTENLAKVLPQVLDWKPDAALVDGDVARLEGTAADYSAFKTRAEPLLSKVPTGMALGNHDHRANFFEAFGKTPTGAQPVAAKHVLVIDQGPVRMVILDSLMQTNVTPGQLGMAQRNWLEQFLKQPDEKPVILVLHHTLDERDGSLVDTDRLLRMVTPVRKVKAILYGHSHVYNYDTLEGMHLINLPAVGYNFNDSQPVGWVAATLTKEGGDFRLFAIGGNLEKNGKTTSLKWRS